MDKLFGEEDSTDSVKSDEVDRDIHKPRFEVNPVDSNNKRLSTETKYEECFLSVVKFQDQT